MSRVFPAGNDERGGPYDDYRGSRFKNLLNRHFHGEMFNGFGFDYTMLRIGSMFLHGVEHPDVRYQDSLAEEHGAETEAYSLMVTAGPGRGGWCWPAAARRSASRRSASGSRRTRRSIARRRRRQRPAWLWPCSSPRLTRERDRSADRCPGGRPAAGCEWRARRRGRAVSGRRRGWTPSRRCNRCYSPHPSGGVFMVGVSLSRTPVVAGTGVVVVGAVAATTGSWSSQLDLRTGVVPWALGALVVGIGLILFGSYRGGIGRPQRLVRWGSNLALVGLGVAAAFFFGTGILAAVGSDLLSAGETLVSAVGTLIASISTLLILPVGLLAFGMAVVIDKQLPGGVRGLPLVGTLAFMLGPVLIAVLPESDERTVFIVWPVLLGAVWAAYGLLVSTELRRELERPSGAG